MAILYWQYWQAGQGEQIRNSKASELSGRPSGTVRRYLVKMVGLGIFTTTGENKTRVYILNDKMSDKMNDK